MNTKLTIKFTHAALIGAVMGAALFLFLYSPAVLNPTYDAWLLQGGDLNQHYLGWKFYRNSPWAFPIGLIQGLTVEPVSVMFTDSIPLLALIFKLLSPILPDTFQYFGLFGIGCFALQGAFGALIVRRFTNCLISVIAGDLFFIFSYIMFVRMYGHTALAANWVILAAFAIFLYRGQFSEKYTSVKLWTGLFCVTSLTHLYFIPMIAAVLFVQALTDGCRDKDWKKMLLMFAAPIGAALAVLYIMGAFYGGISASDGGYGIYSSNLNTFFNPLQYSKFLPALPLAIDSQWEGSAYLGLGAMVLFVAAAVCFFMEIKRIAVNKLGILFGAIAVLGLTLFAVSFRITWGDRILAELAIPGIWQTLGGIFRSGGRLIWPVMYLIIIAAIAGVLLSARRQKWIPAGILAVCAVLQIADLSPMWMGIRNTDRAHTEYSTSMASPAWEIIGNSGLSKVKVFTTYGTYDRREAPIEYYYGLDKTFDLAEFAISHRMSMNDFYLARRSGEMIEQDKVQAYQDILDGNASEDTLYVFLDVPNVLLKKVVLHLYEIDGYVVGLADGSLLSSEGIEELSYGIIRLADWGRIRYSGGQLTGESCILEPGGGMESYDHSIPAGYYQVQITGQNLQNASAVLYDSSTGKAFSLEAGVQQETVMEAYLSLRGSIDTLRLNIQNSGGSQVSVENAVLIPAE